MTRLAPVICQLHLLKKKLKLAHELMLPSSMKLGYRECRDSADHPFTVPVQLYLDVTGSMGDIPVYMIREGLPHIISMAIQKGIKDIALMMGAIGDHESDNVPIQFGQFESADEPLDMWLERIYPEGGGGGNAGESYGLAWFNALKFVKTDAYEKRGKKGFVFTIGDEPVLKNYPGSMLKELYGDHLSEFKANYIAEELLEECLKYNEVFHIHINHGSSRTNMKSLLGQRCIELTDISKIAKTIVDLIVSNSNVEVGPESPIALPDPANTTNSATRITL